MASRRAGRSRFTLFLLVLTSVTLITLDAQDFGPVERTKDLLATVLDPVGDAVGAVVSPVGGLWDRVTGQDDAQDRIDELEAEVADLQQQVIENAGAQEQVARLQEIMDLEGPPGVPSERAEVERGSTSNFDGRVLVITKGTEAGIVKGNPVTGRGGLLGVVADARSGRSVVRLIDDPDFGVRVRVLGSEATAIAYGGGEGQPLVVRDGLRAGLAIEVGDLVVTAGGEDSTYPAGIPVGVVSSVTVDQGQLELVLEITPSGQLRDIEAVVVVRYDPSTAVSVEETPTPTPSVTATAGAEG